MNRKAPTPIRSDPSSAPLEAMVSKQHAHIEELVMKNRTLEQTIQKLRTEIGHEKQRHDDTLRKIEQQFGQERTEWREGCDSLQSLWRIAYLRMVAELEDERSGVFKMKEELRLARLARVQRDYQIAMFQAKEMELEDRVVQLQDELEHSNWSLEQEREKRAGLKEQLRLCVEQLHDTKGECDQYQKSLANLRAEHTTLLASSGAGSAILERTKQQVAELTVSLNEAQEKCTRLQSTNSDLLRQLEKRKTADTRESEATESLRKGKVESDIRIKELEAELDQIEKSMQDREAKLQAKLHKYKDSLAEHAEALKERDEELDQKEVEINNLKEQSEELSDQVKALAAQIDEERAKFRTLSKDVRGVEQLVPKPVVKPRAQSPGSKPKPKPVAKKVKAQSAAESSDEIEEIEHPPKADKKSRTIIPEEVEVEEVGPPVAKKEKKSAPIAGPSKTSKAKVAKPAKDNHSATPEAEEVQPASPSRPTKRKVVETDEEYSPKTKKQKAPDSTTDKHAEKSAKAKPKKALAKPPSQSKGKAVDDKKNSDSEEVEVAQKKKKRKINIFSQSQASAFDWGHLSQGDGGLNIPTELSPVKEGAVVPPRSTSTLGRGLSSTFGSMASRR